MRLAYKNSFVLSAIALTICLDAAEAFAQTTSFTYQGKLTDGGTAANGNYDFQFALWDSLAGGTQVGSTQTANNVSVSNGVFIVTLDFGASSLSGANLYVEISARPTGSGPFTLLTPRQQITSTPYAVRSANASSANALSTSCSGCITDTQIGSVAASKLTGTIPASAVPTGSGNTILGNFIGTNADGSGPASANQGDGVFVSSANDQIGGANPADRNVISGNFSNGVHFFGNDAQNNSCRAT